MALTSALQKVMTLSRFYVQGPFRIFTCNCRSLLTIQCQSEVSTGIRVNLTGKDGAYSAIVRGIGHIYIFGS